MPKDFYIKKVNELMEENDRLKRANAALEPKIPKGNSLDEGDFQRWCVRIDVLFSEILKVQEKLIGLRSRAKILAFRDKLKTNISELLETFPAAHNVQKVSNYLRKFYFIGKRKNNCYTCYQRMGAFINFVFFLKMP